MLTPVRSRFVSRRRHPPKTADALESTSFELRLQLSNQPVGHLVWPWVRPPFATVIKEGLRKLEEPRGA